MLRRLFFVWDKRDSAKYLRKYHLIAIFVAYESDKAT